MNKIYIEAEFSWFGERNKVDANGIAWTYDIYNSKWKDPVHLDDCLPHYVNRYYEALESLKIHPVDIY